MNGIRLRERVVGAAMRSYRRSPLFPAWGQRLARLLSLLPAPQRAVRVIDGVTFDLDLAEVIDSSLYYSGTFEQETERVITSHLRPGMVALDIGANVGYHTFRIARAVAPKGRVVAVEPMSRARTRLERNIFLNPSIDNIMVTDVGISDEAHTEEISFRSSWRLDGRQETAEEKVRLLTLDGLVEELELPRVDFLKVDVDGFELKFFRGAETTLADYRPVIVFELWPEAVRRAGDDPRELAEIFARHCYSLENEDGSPTSVEDVISSIGDYSVNLVAAPRFTGR